MISISIPSRPGGAFALDRGHSSRLVSTPIPPRVKQRKDSRGRESECKKRKEAVEADICRRLA
ncbi:MAG: hypothetical protein ABIL25_01215, partial [candidate division WOR-3 bacterium]